MKRIIVESYPVPTYLTLYPFIMRTVMSLAGMNLFILPVLSRMKAFRGCQYGTSYSYDIFGMIISLML